jgi:hypothetical protein
MFPYVNPFRIIGKTGNPRGENEKGEDEEEEEVARGNLRRPLLPLFLL